MIKTNINLLCIIGAFYDDIKLGIKNFIGNTTTCDNDLMSCDMDNGSCDIDY